MTRLSRQVVEAVGRFKMIGMTTVSGSSLPTQVGPSGRKERLHTSVTFITGP